MAPRWFSILPLVVWLLSGTSDAQTTLGSVGGVVRDGGQLAVSGVTVTLVSDATGQVRTAVTSESGDYFLPLVPPGEYRIRIEAPGYQPYEQPVRVAVNQALRADVILHLGTLTGRVEVRASLADLRRDAAGQGTLIDNHLITAVPLDGRNFLELSLLVPGTAPAAEGAASSVRGDFSFTANGLRDAANAFLLDGVDNTDPKLNTVAVRPPVDAISEFEVLTASYEAAFGRHAGAQVNVAVRSGANQLHGSTFEFYRGSGLDAANAFAPEGEERPEYSRHQFGGSLGGPIVRDRLFFFADYEGTRLEEGLTRITTVPTPRERAGDFSQSAVRPVNPLTGTPFPGDVIPDVLQHPVGRAIAALYPAPNRAGAAGNFVSSPVQDDRHDHVDARVDYRHSTAGAIMARYSVGDRALFEPFAGPAFAAVPGYGNDVTRRGHNLAASDTHVFSPSIVNDLRVGFTRVAGRVRHEGAGVSLNRQVGLPELSDDPRDYGLSFIRVGGYTPLGQEYNNPQESTTDAWQIVNTTTWTAGRHLVKAGLDMRAVRQNAFRDVQARGFLTFSEPSFYTGHPLADLLLGLPSVTGGAHLDNPQRLRTESWALFAQDSWRVRVDLTISAGLRYELISPPVDVEDRATVYDPRSGELVRVGTGGVPRAGYRTDRNNLAPRIGAAWSLPGGRETVVRGGYGIYYHQSALAPSEGLYFNPPYFDLNFFFPLPGLPLTLSDPFPAAFPFPVPQSATAFEPELSTPLVHHWSVGVQHELGEGRSVEIAYVGTRGSQLLRGRDLNQAAPSAAPQNPRPDVRFADITIIESASRSRYHGLHARLQQRLRAGLTLLGSYGYGKALDDASGFFPSAGDPNFPQDSRNPRLEWGRSSHDVRHRFSVAFAWDLPGRDGSTWSDRLLAGWQLAGVVTAQSGRPFTVALLPDRDNSNTGLSSLGFGANDRPNVVRDPALDDPSAERWFDTSAFELPPFGSFGNAGRNILDGPGYGNVSLALSKNVPLTGAARLQLRIEGFNVLNRTNYDGPDAFFGSATFGQVLSAGSPRRFQFGAKLHF